MKKITLCLMLILTLLIIPGAILATEPSLGNTTTEVIAKPNVSTEAELEAALKDDSISEITLENDITLTTLAEVNTPSGIRKKAGIAIERSVTIIGNSHTIQTSELGTAVEVHNNGEEKINVTFDNVKIVVNTAGGRCIDTRTGKIVLNINNSSLKTTKGSYDQALTIGGDAASDIEVNIKNSSIFAGSHYAIIAFNPVKLTIEGCKAIGGFTSLYMKDGSAGSEININNSELLGRNKWAAVSGTFGTVVLEDENLKIDVKNSTLSAIEEDTGLEYIIQDKVGGNTITTKGTTINAATTTMSIKDTTKITFGDQSILKDSSVTSVEVLSSFLPNGAVAKLTGENEYTVFEPHTITIKEVEGGKVTADKTIAVVGEKITLTVTVKEGYKLEKIEIEDEGMGDTLIGETTFEMYPNDMTVTPVFIKVTHEAEVPNEVANEKETEEMLVETLKETIVADSTLAEKIEGKNIEVEVKVNQENKTVTDTEKTKIETEAAKEVKDIKVAKYIDITIVVKDADLKTEIDTLGKVKEEITFTVDIPELPAVAEGYVRTYYIVRNHNGEIKILDTKVSEDGKSLEFASNLFSTYAIAYSDTKIVNEAPSVPKTGDNVILYIALALVAMAGIVVAIKLNKKH